MQNPTDQVVLTLAGESHNQQSRAFPHPIATFFHIAFRLAAAVTYLFCGWFSGSFITSFVVVVLLVSMDFWTTKNITGRLLAGLRWWNYVDDSGKSHWMYESRATQQRGGAGGEGSGRLQVSAAEARLFWLSIVATQVVWTFFFFASILTLNLRWVLVVLVASALNGANFYGYVRCRFGAKKNLTDVAKGYFVTGAISSMMQRFSGGSSATPTTSGGTDGAPAAVPAQG